MSTGPQLARPVSTAPFTAYIPCYNAAATIRRAVESVLAQTIRPAETLVIDDGSTDGSSDTVRDLDARIVTLPRNTGRGEARAQAMSEARHELVLCCDATNVLEPRFVEQAMAWFAGARVAAVFGRITQGPETSVVDRWRGRHLYRVDISQQVNERASLCTGAALMRASVVASVGGYDRARRHTEDADLGTRLLAAGWSVVYDPRLTFTSISKNSLAQVLERHWRWHTGAVPTASWREYRKSVGYSIKCMAREDLRAGDPLSIPISLVSPHYHLWRSLW